MAKFSLKRRLKKVKSWYFLFVNRVLKKSQFTNEILLNNWLIVDKYTYGEPLILIFPGETTSKVFIGKFCSIAQNVEIFTGGNHNTNWVTTYPFSEFSNTFPNGKSVKGHPTSKGEIYIGNDVWIGRGATIMSGVRIGDGAVIGANCLVSSNVKPYEIVVGNPMKVIKKRFSEDIIEKLLVIGWWNWDKEKINEEIPNLCSKNIQEFVTRHFESN